MVLASISLTTSDVECHFTCHLCQLRSLVPSVLGCHLLLLSYESALCVSRSVTPYRHTACDCFLPSLGCLFTLLLVSFDAQKCHILMKSHSFVFSVVAMLAVSCQRYFFLFLIHICTLHFRTCTWMLSTCVGHIQLSNFRILSEALLCLAVIVSFGTDCTALIRRTRLIIVLLQIPAPAASCVLCVMCTTAGTRGLQ